MHDNIYSHNKNIPMLWVIELNQEKKINTSFGTMLVGWALSNQCGLIPPDYNIYCNLQDPKKKCNQIYLRYPLFSFKETNDRLSQYIFDLKDDPKFKFIHGLKEASNEIEFIEASTWEQANDLVLFKHRRYRFTASLCNEIGDTSPKTPKGSRTLAQSVVHGNEKIKNTVSFNINEHISAIMTQ